MFEIDNTTVVCIDIQEKLTRAINNPKIVENVVKLLRAASLLGVDTVITEQYPKGLGSTIEPVKSLAQFETVEKKTFSAFQTDEFRVEFNKLNNRNVLVFGIETHICVLQTALDLIKDGYKVYVVKDCCASRNDDDHNAAFDIIKQTGGLVVTLEIVLFEFMKSSRHPMFKEIQNLIK